MTPNETLAAWTTLAKMCASGRNINVLLPSHTSSDRDPCRFTVSHTKFLCVRMQPFGMPVVPDVYTSVARSSWAIEAILCLASARVSSVAIAWSAATAPSSIMKTPLHSGMSLETSS